MAEINIHNEPCNCPPGQCAEMIERDENCINRLSGDVRTINCETCGAHTWHQNSRCLRCRPFDAAAALTGTTPEVAGQRGK